MPWPSRAYFTAIWTRPTVYGHRVQHGAPEARILLMPKHSCDFLFTKGGWIRRYSIYCILGKNAWSPAMMVSLKYFPIILTKNSPLKFLFHFSLFFFPPPVLQHQVSWEEGGGESRTLWQPFSFLFLTSLQEFPTSHQPASLQLFYFLLNPMAHQGADTECKKQSNRKYSLLRSSYHTHFLLCTDYDGSAQRLSLWRAYRWAKSMPLSRWKSSLW